ncbi:hypothetical protein XELAEV_18036467mg [Xenopus laevis]|uniref:Uncharacterized protein n=1 Tax=Xenopus laevis TaxID=8355 RepID=A0A974HD27_XENLA|nr:hypothetical protein XELAEV_18036467mg [Xenopus laevis]
MLYTEPRPASPYWLSSLSHTTIVFAPEWIVPFPDMGEGGGEKGIRTCVLQGWGKGNTPVSTDKTKRWKE